MKKFLATALLLASVLPAAAQTTPSTGTPPLATQATGPGAGTEHGHHRDWSPACKAKIAQMCPSVQPGVKPVKGAIHDCLTKQNTTFAQVCPEDAAAFKAEREAHKEGGAPMTNSGAPAGAPAGGQ